MPCRSPKDLEVHWFSLIAQNKFAELGEELKVLRQRVGLTQLEVCQAALGATISHAVLSRLERGVLQQPSRDTLAQLAAYYGTVDRSPEADEAVEAEASEPTPEWQLCLQNLFWQAPPERLTAR